MPTPKLELPIHAQPSMRSLDRATLFRLCSWADEGEIERAGEHAAQLLQKGVYDYQLVVLWLAHRFAAEGTAVLVQILEAATQQLLLDLDSTARSDRHVEARTLDRAFSWLVSNITQRIHFHSKMRDGSWARWLTMVDPEWMDAFEKQIEASIGRLQGAVEHMASAIAPDELSKLDRRVKGVFKGIVEEVRQQRAQAALATRSEEPEPIEEPALPNVEPPEADAERPPVPEHSSPVSAGSERLRMLRRKLEGFGELARRRDLRRAAIVARDVERELAQFDPLLYLPELFEGYLSVLLEVGAELEEYMGEGEGLDQRALERLYHADPLQFLDRAAKEDTA